MKKLVLCEYQNNVYWKEKKKRRKEKENQSSFRRKLAEARRRYGISVENFIILRLMEKVSRLLSIDTQMERR